MENNFPLFYKKPTALNTQTHLNLAFTDTRNFAFAQDELAIPVLASEFMPLIRHYPIVFTQSETPSAVAILGIKQGKNCFINAGEWAQNTYIPAYVRRYPFAFFDTTDEQSNVKQLLAVDLAAENFIEDGRTSHPDRCLFTEAGEHTDILKSALNFCEQFHQQALVTQAFIQDLKAHELLTPNTLTIKENDGKEHKVEGFMLIDSAKYNALPDATLLEFQKKGWLSLITLQIASQQNWQLLVDKNSQL